MSVITKFILRTKKYTVYPVNYMCVIQIPFIQIPKNHFYDLICKPRSSANVGVNSFINTHQNIQKYRWYSTELHLGLLLQGSYPIYRDRNYNYKNTDQKGQKVKPRVFPKFR